MSSSESGGTVAAPSDARSARLSDPHRLTVLRATGLLHGASNPVLDGIARVTAQALGAPIAFVALVDDRREHLPGLAGRDGTARGTPLAHSRARLVVEREAPVILAQATGPDGAEVADVAEGGAFAGVPVRLRTGETLGALCAMHRTPFSWRAEQVATLEDLAAAAAAEIERLLLGQALVQTEAKWREQVERDSQTGLFNRRGFLEQTRHHLALAQRTAAPFCLALIDIDRLRVINEVFGHDAGDRALADIAGLLRTVSRETDVLARLDGDAFAVLLCNTNREEAGVFVRRVEEALAALNATPGRAYQLHASLGVASWTIDAPHTLATLLRVAEEAVHIAKGHRAAQFAPSDDRLSPGRLSD